VRAWLTKALSACELSEEASQYLLGRGLLPEVIRAWGFVTWDPSEEPCPDALLAEKLGPHWERLEGRVIYPLYSPRGLLLGFECRTPYLKDVFRLLLPDASGYPVWIGMPGAMGPIWEGRPVIVVEGFFDVAALHHVVSGAVVLGSGPSQLSHAQLDFLRRFRPEVHMVYDMDKAGRRGAEQAYKALLRHGVSCYVHSYGQEGDDPGLIWQRGGRDLLRKMFSEILDL